MSAQTFMAGTAAETDSNSKCSLENYISESVIMGYVLRPWTTHTSHDLLVALFDY